MKTEVSHGHTQFLLLHIGPNVPRMVVEGSELGVPLGWTVGALDRPGCVFVPSSIGMSRMTEDELLHLSDGFECIV